jgi:hypothetical protein
MSNELDDVKRELTAERDRYRRDAAKAKTQPSTSPAMEDAMAKLYQSLGLTRPRGNR